MAPPDENSAENHLRFDEPKFATDGDRKPSGTDVNKGGSIYAKPDLEGGEEYANLVAYISSYYEGPRRKSVVSMEEQDAAAKRPWWKFWGKKKDGISSEEGFEVPDDVGRPCGLSTDVVFQLLIDLSLSSGSRPTSSMVLATVTSKLVGSVLVSMNWSVFSPARINWIDSNEIDVDHGERKHVPQGKTRFLPLSMPHHHS